VLEPVRAWRVNDDLRADPRVNFLPEQAGFSEHWRHTGEQILGGPNAWTDSYLAAFAAYAAATVVTFDRRFKANGMPPRDVAPNLSVSIPTLYRWLPASAQP
jgi:predicted nucleic acid-binding protein